MMRTATRDHGHALPCDEHLHGSRGSPARHPVRRLGRWSGGPLAAVEPRPAPPGIGSSSRDVWNQAHNAYQPRNLYDDNRVCRLDGF
jgi:hypothetical protein